MKCIVHMVTHLFSKEDRRSNQVLSSTRVLSVRLLYTVKTNPIW